MTPGSISQNRWANQIKKIPITLAVLVGLRLFLILIAITSVIITIAGTAAHWIEPETFPRAIDGIWWAAETLSTVGYGDFAPKTLLGRALGVVVMFGGFFLLSVVTAVIVSLTIIAETAEIESDLKEEESIILQELEKMQNQIQELQRLITDGS